MPYSPITAALMKKQRTEEEFRYFSDVLIQTPSADALVQVKRTAHNYVVAAQELEILKTQPKEKK